MLIRSIVGTVMLALSATALADVHISFVDDSGHTASQMYVKDGKVRMEGGGSEHAVMLYDTASNTMQMLMPDRKAYMVFNEQTASQMGSQMQSQMAAHQSQMADAQSKMQAAMAKMTPEQRAAMEKMMASHGGMPGAESQTGAPQVDIKDLGTTETVAGHTCKDMQVTMNGRPGMQLCVAAADSLGIPAADLATLKKMRDGMQQLMSHMGPMAQGMQSMMADGFAIKRQHPQLQQYKMVTVTETLQSISTGTVSSSLFTLPAGYKETTMAQLMQGGHP